MKLMLNQQPMCPSLLSRYLFIGLVSLFTELTFVLPAHCQVSPEDHAKHHPEQAQKGASTGQGSGGMEGMGGMMEHMTKPPAKELYPSLMELPELSPEQRDNIRRQAFERMKTGTAMWSEALERMSKAAESEDYAAMQEATAQMREGLALYESGLAAQRALAEGKSPRSVALQWFKREMGLYPQGKAEAQHGILGLSWSHFFLMVTLSGFAAGMIWMYFHKMRRAAALLERLTASAPSKAPTEPKAGKANSTEPSAAIPETGPIPKPGKDVGS